MYSRITCRLIHIGLFARYSFSIADKAALCIGDDFIFAYTRMLVSMKIELALASVIAI